MPRYRPRPYHDCVARIRPAVLDLGLALGLAGASLLIGADLFGQSPATVKMASQFGSVDAWRQAVVVWWFAAGVMVAGLAVRRRWPLVALAAVTGGAASHLATQHWPMLPIDYGVPIALYTLAALTRRRSVPLTALALLLLGAYLIQLAPYANLWSAASQAYPMLLVLTLAYVLGDGVRTRRIHLGTVEQRAADLEREQAQRAALAAVAERARITRELHDVVAHGLSVMVVQAQGAAAALDRHPDRTAAALRQVIATGRASLAEMRRLLGVVRRDPAGDPQLAPQPGLGALPALVDHVRAAGTPVRLEITGEPVPVPAGLDLSAYRIVQEALTNTIKHAGPGATVVIGLDYRTDRLDIEVTDDGTGGPVPATGGGSGLRGIAERVGMLGGELTVGPGAAGGFQVRASLPFAAVPALERP